MNSVISLDGTAIKYEESGTGPLLVLIGDVAHHKTDRLLDFLTPVLEPHFTVLQYVRRDPGKLHLSVEQHIAREIEDLSAILDIHGGSVFTFGVSTGACLAIKARQAGLPIIKLATYECPPTIKSRHKPENQFNAASLLQFVALRNKGQTLKILLRTIGKARVACAMVGLALIWPAFKALAPHLAYDELSVREELPHAIQDQADPVSTTILSSNTNRLKEALRMLFQRLPQVMHETISNQNHDVDPLVLGRALVGIFSRSMAKSS